MARIWIAENSRLLLQLTARRSLTNKPKTFFTTFSKYFKNLCYNAFTVVESFFNLPEPHMKPIDVESVIKDCAKKNKRNKVLELMPQILQLVEGRVPYSDITRVVSESIGEQISQNYIYLLVREVRDGRPVRSAKAASEGVPA